MAKRPRRASGARAIGHHGAGRAQQGPRAPRAPRGDGIVRVRREVQGRPGRGVTTISGLPLASDRLRELASELKRLCGSGGSVRDGVVKIQGDHRDAIVTWLVNRDFSVEGAGS